MKVLIIHNHYQQTGGENIAVNAQIELLNQHGHSLSFYIQDNHEIDTYSPLQKLAIGPRAIYSLRAYQDIRKLIAEIRPDVAHIHNVFPLISPAVYRTLSKLGIPIVQTLHNFRFLCPNGLFFTQGKICERCKKGNTLHAVAYKCYRDSYLLSALYALSIGLHRRMGTFHLINRFIALTGFTAGKMIESGLATEDKLSILGNFLPDTSHKGGSIQPGRPYILFIGRLSLEKGVMTLLQAMNGIRELDLKIAGDGPQMKELQLATHNLDLSNVVFLGRITGSPKWELLQNATAVVVPSLLYENFPLSILESMSVGTLVVTSDIGSIPYIISDGQTGLLFRPGNADDLREKINWLTAHPNDVSRLAQNGKNNFTTNYSAEAHYNSLINIYKETIEGNMLH